MADAKDLKSFVPLGTCGFESRPGYCCIRAHRLACRCPSLQRARRCGGPLRTREQPSPLLSQRTGLHRTACYRVLRAAPRAAPRVAPRAALTSPRWCQCRSLRVCRPSPWPGGCPVGPSRPAGPATAKSSRIICATWVRSGMAKTGAFGACVAMWAFRATGVNIFGRLVPRLCLGTHCIAGSAGLLTRRSLAPSGLRGRAS
jgi:hypothetical protein